VSFAPRPGEFRLANRLVLLSACCTARGSLRALTSADSSHLTRVGTSELPSLCSNESCNGIDRHFAIRAGNALSATGSGRFCQFGMFAKRNFCRRRSTLLRLTRSAGAREITAPNRERRKRLRYPPALSDKGERSGSCRLRFSSSRIDRLQSPRNSASPHTNVRPAKAKRTVVNA